MNFIPVGKKRTLIKDLTFQESDLERIHDLMLNFKVHKILSAPGRGNASSNLFPVQIFKTKTNILSCRRCNFITLKKRNAKHDCIYDDSNQEDPSQDSNPEGPSQDSNPEDPSQDTNPEDQSQDSPSNADDTSTVSSDAASPNKRQCFNDLSYQSPPENEPSSSNFQRCSNAYYLQHGNLSMRIECHEIATPHHRVTCQARFGSGYASEKWVDQEHNRNMFLHYVLEFVMASKMRGSFAKVFNTALAKLESTDQWKVETSRSTANVQISTWRNNGSFLISSGRGTKIISSDTGIIRELTGEYSSRRQFEQKLKVLRRMNIKLPKNMRRSLASSRDQIKRYSEIIEFSNIGSSVCRDWSALVCFTRSGLEDYLNQLIMESQAFDYSNSLSIAIDAGTVLKRFIISLK